VIVLGDVIVGYEEIDEEIASHPRKKRQMGPQKANALGPYGPGQELYEGDEDHDPGGEAEGEADEPGTCLLHDEAEQAPDGCRKPCSHGEKQCYPHRSITRIS
jgi:hypothetical protein